MPRSSSLRLIRSALCSDSYRATALNCLANHKYDATLRSQARTSEIIRGIRFVWALLINTIIGVVLIFLTNLFLSPPIPINILTILISAIGGVIGWLIILILHLLGVAFV